MKVARSVKVKRGVLQCILIGAFCDKHTPEGMLHKAARCEDTGVENS
jgi:hypothetical protein